MGFIYLFVKYLMKICINTFFRDIQVIGENNFPKSGPTIIYAMHRNQFIDGAILTQLFNREICYIAAKKSFNRPVIGDLIKAMSSIPVERAQDLAFTGKGKLSIVNNNLLLGIGTQFTEQIKMAHGCTLYLPQLNSEVTVLKVIDDEHLEIKMEAVQNLPQSCASVKEFNYKIINGISQTALFENVFTSLAQGKCIGIFPEGGSHDNTENLPLKAGICIMAMGYQMQYPKLQKVQLVPIGLNYFKGHKFRSKVIVDIGLPFTVEDRLMDMYKMSRESKRQAISELLLTVTSKLKGVTLTANSYNELSNVYMAREIYKSDQLVNAEQDMILIQRFLLGYQKFKENQQVMQMMKNIDLYKSRLKRLKIEDYQVGKYNRNTFLQLFFLLTSLIRFVFSLVFSLPGLIMTAPLAFILQYLSEQERKKALAGSRVKLTAKDVVGSYKIICAIVIFPINSYIFTILYYFMHVYYFHWRNPFYCTLLFFILWPLYALIMVRSSDGVLRNFKTIYAKLIFILKPSYYTQLRFFRRNIFEHLRKFVDQYSGEVIQKGEERIITKDQFNKVRNTSQIFECLEESGM